MICGAMSRKRIGKTERRTRMRATIAISPMPRKIEELNVAMRAMSAAFTTSVKTKEEYSGSADKRSIVSWMSTPGRSAK